MHWFLDPILNHYADFNGRTPRKAFWMFILMYLVLLFLSMMLLGIIMGEYSGATLDTYFFIIGAFLLLLLALMIPVVAIHVRRFHDVGYSGWWYLLNFIPYLGGLVVLVMMCLPSQEGSNKYGPHPYAGAVPLPPGPVPVPLPLPPTEQPPVA